MGYVDCEEAAGQADRAGTLVRLPGAGLEHRSCPRHQVLPEARVQCGLVSDAKVHVEPEQLHPDVQEDPGIPENLQNSFFIDQILRSHLQQSLSYRVERD